MRGSMGGGPRGIDRNRDGIPDAAQVDRNLDGIPDAMQVDRNRDGIPDAAQGIGVRPVAVPVRGVGVPPIPGVVPVPGVVGGGIAQDRNRDGIPDAMQVDRNFDGIPDAAQGYGARVATGYPVAPVVPVVPTVPVRGVGMMNSGPGVVGPGMAHDRNRDGIPDAMQVDRNFDGIPDAAQVDRNRDGIPDAAQTPLYGGRAMPRPPVVPGQGAANPLGMIGDIIDAATRPRR